jgi:uncharacterized protein (TIGR00297 family)
LRNSRPALIVTVVPDFAASWSVLGSRWAIAALLTLAFTVLARRVRGVTRSGAAAGALCCFILYLGGGAAAFAALITVFALTWITTRLGYRRKQNLGIAERREGRKASQILANLGVATGCAGLYAFGHHDAVLLPALAAALGEAAADTVSSEVGQAFGEQARMITTWVSVPAGTNGAVTARGTLAGISAAGVVALVCFLGGLLPRPWLAVSTGAAILGMVADSFLGACLETRGLLNNDSVNFLSTLAAALMVFLVI